MSVKGSRILNELHPWLRVRIQYLDDVVTHFRGTFIYFSGFRTVTEQARLVAKRGFFSRPVALPGCSQHQYSYAVDVGITGPIIEMTDDPEFVNSIDALARQIGLVTVRGDKGHFQVFPGSEFREAVSALGWCPDPDWSSRRRRRSVFSQYTDCLTAATSDTRRAFCFQRWVGEQSAIQGLTFTALPGRL